MKGIIYYFSGTGNTYWIAEKFKKIFEEHGHQVELEDMGNNEGLSIDKHDFFVLGTPVYAEGVPKLVSEAVGRIGNLENTKKIILYTTQAGKSSAALSMLESELRKKRFSIAITKAIQMPNNYYFVAGKKTTEERRKKLLINAERQVSIIVADFLKGKVHKNKSSVFRNLASKISIKSFEYFLPKLSKNIAASGECIKCGLCLRNCPRGNITFENGKAIFHSHCMMCVRCIHICPMNAIQYKNKKIEQTQKSMITMLKVK